VPPNARKLNTQRVTEKILTQPATRQALYRIRLITGSRCHPALLFGCAATRYGSITIYTLPARISLAELDREKGNRSFIALCLAGRSLAAFSRS
jgi:hypothetical protein